MIDQFHHPEDPNILILSNVKKDGQPTGLQDAGSYFHTDYSYLQVPARATTLYSRVVPNVGGDTLFANQQAAYDDLSDAMKKRIEPLLGIHHYGNRNDQDESSRTVASVLTPEQKAKMPVITHRLARPHPVTGRKSLYAVSGSSFGIVGMPDDEARDLLDELAAHSTQAQYQLRFKYGVGDVVVWDNASLLHSATLIDPDDARTLWRITDARTRAGRHGAASAGPDVRRPDDVIVAGAATWRAPFASPGVYATTCIVPSMFSWPVPQNTSHRKMNSPVLFGVIATSVTWPGMIVPRILKSGTLKPITTSALVNWKMTGSFSLSVSSAGS